MIFKKVILTVCGFLAMASIAAQEMPTCKSGEYMVPGDGGILTCKKTEMQEKQARRPVYEPQTRKTLVIDR